MKKKSLSALLFFYADAFAFSECFSSEPEDV